MKNIKELNNMKKFIIYLKDIDPDTGNVSQVLEIARTQFENYAKIISNQLSLNDEEPNRTYKYIASEIDVVETLENILMEELKKINKVI
jgi:CRISPR/Cas system-associated protein endoribonuclease Cas2